MTIEDLVKTIRIEGTSHSTILSRAIGPRENSTMWCSWVRIVLTCSENESLYICFISLPPFNFFNEQNYIVYAYLSSGSNKYKYLQSARFCSSTDEKSCERWIEWFDVDLITTHTINLWTKFTEYRYSILNLFLSINAVSRVHEIHNFLVIILLKSSVITINLATSGGSHFVCLQTKISCCAPGQCIQLAESFPWHARMQWRIQVKAAE